jgi:hypothetical protein
MSLKDGNRWYPAYPHGGANGCAYDFPALPRCGGGFALMTDNRWDCAYLSWYFPSFLM